MEEYFVNFYHTDGRTDRRLGLTSRPSHDSSLVTDAYDNYELLFCVRFYFLCFTIYVLTLIVEHKKTEPLVKCSGVDR